MCTTDLMHGQHFLPSGAVEENESNVAREGSDFGRPVFPVLHRVKVVVTQTFGISENLQK